MLSKEDVTRFLDMESCIEAVAGAFRARGEGRLASSVVVGLELVEGSIHAKLGALDLDRAYAAAKINTNFPDNPAGRGLPTVQGLLILFDAASGVPLACMDSASITAVRTAAASAVAAIYLALPDAFSLAFIGCGAQARAHVAAFFQLRSFKKVVVFDRDRGSAERFAAEIEATRHVQVTIAASPAEASRSSQIVITSTSSRQAILDVGDVEEGTFIAAVGADNEHKQEISPALLRSAAVVVDDIDQCCRIGDLHHALDAGVMRRHDVRASLDQIVAGLVRGRLDDREILVFDSTGVAIEDVAAAALVYERAEMAAAAMTILRS